LKPGSAEATGEVSQSRWRKIGIALFKLWSAIRNHRPADVNAMTLATGGSEWQTFNQDRAPQGRG